MLTIANSEQRQEQVHSVAAQVRTPVEHQTASCCSRCPYYTKALGNLLCYVNIVWFGEYVSNRIHTKPRDSASVDVLAMLEFDVDFIVKPCRGALFAAYHMLGFGHRDQDCSHWTMGWRKDTYRSFGGAPRMRSTWRNVLFVHGSAVALERVNRVAMYLLLNKFSWLYFNTREDI
jgi:hypothetical protein